MEFPNLLNYLQQWGIPAVNAWAVDVHGAISDPDPPVNRRP